MRLTTRAELISALQSIPNVLNIQIFIAAFTVLIVLLNIGITLTYYRKMVRLLGIQPGMIIPNPHFSNEALSQPTRTTSTTSSTHVIPETDESSVISLPLPMSNIAVRNESSDSTSLNPSSCLFSIPEDSSDGCNYFLNNIKYEHCLSIIEWMNAVMFQYRQMENISNESDAEISNGIPLEIWKIMDKLYEFSITRDVEDVRKMEIQCKRLFSHLRHKQQLQKDFRKFLEFKFYCPEFLHRKSLTIYFVLHPKPSPNKLQRKIESVFGNLKILQNLFEEYFKILQISISNAPRYVPPKS